LSLEPLSPLGALESAGSAPFSWAKLGTDKNRQHTLAATSESPTLLGAFETPAANPIATLLEPSWIYSYRFNPPHSKANSSRPYL